MEFTMKMIVAVPFALLTFGMLGCYQHPSTPPGVTRPTPAAETNTFGESRDETAGSAASARAANYGAESTAPK